MNKPFRAPIYRTYYECAKGLYRQGIFAFYKGNGLRMAHWYLYLSLLNDLNFKYLDKADVLRNETNYIKLFGA